MAACRPPIPPSLGLSVLFLSFPPLGCTFSFFLLADRLERKKTRKPRVLEVLEVDILWPRWEGDGFRNTHSHKKNNPGPTTHKHRQSRIYSLTHTGEGIHHIIITKEQNKTKLQREYNQLGEYNQSVFTHLPAWRTGPHAHTLHTIGSGADTRHTVTGRSTRSGLLDTQHTAHRTAHEVAL